MAKPKHSLCTHPLCTQSHTPHKATARTPPPSRATPHNFHTLATPAAPPHAPSVGLPRSAACRAPCRRPRRPSAPPPAGASAPLEQPPTRWRRLRARRHAAP
eukprot:328695-Chlamydomonas_euryale.AAC.2